MKKILLGTLIAANFLLAADNLVTIIEDNSLFKIGKSNISSFMDSSNSLNIYEGYKNKIFKNHSPYLLTDFSGAYDITPNIITMIGEKSIQYGSIYSKGFSEKYNINTLGLIVKKEQFSLALETLDKFTKNDLIYVRTNLNKYYYNDFIDLEKYIKANLNKDKQEKYFNKLNYIYEILDYTNNLYEISKNTSKSINVKPYNAALYDFKSVYLSQNEDYEFNGPIVSKYCDAPTYEYTYDGDGGYYNQLVYQKKLLGQVDISKPIPLTSMYVFKNSSCPYIGGKKKYNKKIIYPTLASIAEQKQSIIMDVKRSRNGGSYLSNMQTLYSNLNNNLSNSLDKLNKRGINNGKIMHINYSLSENIINETLTMGILKSVTVGSIFYNKINLLTNEAFIYDIDNPPSYFQDKTNTISELSIKDTSGTNFNTLYYVVNQKIESNVPELTNFYSKSNLTPEVIHNDNNINNINGSEIVWLSSKTGNYLSPFKYNNPDELLFGSEDEMDYDKLIENVKNYTRTEIDLKENAKEYYPLNIKGIVMDYLPKNKETNSVKYFGPLFESKLYFDIYTKVYTTKEKLDCSIDACTPAELAATKDTTKPYPTKNVEKREQSFYCGMEFTNPDTTNYEYFVFEKIFNRVIEEPFGDIQYHKYKEFNKESEEIYLSDQKVPSIVQYIGRVESTDDCIAKANIKLKDTLTEELIQNNVLNFDFSENQNVLSDDEMTKYGENSDKITSMIDELMISKNILTNNINFIGAEIEDNVDYNMSQKETFNRYFNKVIIPASNNIGEVNGIQTAIIK